MSRTSRPPWDLTARAWMLAAACALVAAGCESSTTVATVTPTPVAQVSAVMLRGTVRDTAFQPVAGATVTLVSDSGNGVSTTSSATGAFAFSGQFAPTDSFRASKDGYVEQTRPFGRELSFTLQSLTPPVDVRGSYALTLIADTSCAQLPAEVHTRTFTATISDYGRVSGATLFSDWYEFGVYLSGNLVNFLFDFDGHPWLVEQLGDTAYLAYQGRAVTSVSSGATTIAASFDGLIEYCDTGVPMVDRYNCQPVRPAQRAQCTSHNHQLILTRR